MTYFYDSSTADHYGSKFNGIWHYYEGTYITPNGALFDVDGYAKFVHAGGFVIPFFESFVNPDKQNINYYSKKEMLESLIEWEKTLRTQRYYDVHIEEQRMRLYLVKYLINVYKSRHLIWDDENCLFDLSEVTGLPNGTDNLYGRDRLLKDILVQACNYDSIESQLDKTITTSKFNIYETFYDYILYDYRVFQIPKKCYDVKQERYINWAQPEWMISGKEIRLKNELEAIKRNIPVEERRQYCRSRVRISR